jgi:hypothetical protein
MSSGQAAELDQSIENSQQLIQGAELVDVQFARFSGELHDVEQAKDVTSFDFELSMSYRVRGRRFDCRYDAKAPLRRSSDELVATLDVAVVVSFCVQDEKILDGDAISAFMDRVGYYVAMPFFREAIQSLSVRLGLNALTIGLLQEGNPGPATATKRGRPNVGRAQT